MILITRPALEAQAMAAFLKQRGYQSFVEPMLEIEALTSKLEPAQNVQAYIITSQNARAYAPAQKPLVAIPEQGKNVQELLNWTTENLKPQAGPLVYLRGREVSFELAPALREHAFEVEERMVYQSIARPEFSQAFIEHLPDLRIATFFSRRTLQTFLSLAARSSLEIKHLSALCLSREIAELAIDHFRAVYISAEPNLKSLLEKLDEVY